MMPLLSLLFVTAVFILIFTLQPLFLRAICQYVYLINSILSQEHFTLGHGASKGEGSWRCSQHIPLLFLLFSLTMFTASWSWRDKGTVNPLCRLLSIPTLLAGAHPSKPPRILGSLTQFTISVTSSVFLLILFPLCFVCPSDNFKLAMKLIFSDHHCDCYCLKQTLSTCTCSQSNSNYLDVLMTALLSEHWCQ